MHLSSSVIARDPALGDIVEITLGNPHNGMFMKVLSIGASITTLVVPDTNGQLTDIVLGFDRWEDYLENDPHIGAVCGRYANRIKDAAFVLNEKPYVLDINNGPNSLHGGKIGFSRRNWQVTEMEKDDTQASVTLKYYSADGEEGYPGNLEIKVTYTLTATQSVELKYEAVSDSDTVLNLTNHTYFNLKGTDSHSDILSHIVWMPAEHYLELDKDCCPTGKVLPVRDTPFDFRTPHAIGDRIFAHDRQMQSGKGYDTNYCYETPENLIKEVAQVRELGSSRKMTVYTDMPGVQLYTGNWLEGTVGKRGVLYHDYSGFCFETQQWPAAPNFTHFPSATLPANVVFSSRTIYQFSSGI